MSDNNTQTATDESTETVRVVYKKPKTSNKRKLAYGVGALALIGAGVGGYFLLRNGGGEAVVEAAEAATEAAA